MNSVVRASPSCQFGRAHTGDAEEAAIKRALSRRSAETYVLATSEKIGAASPFTVIPMHEATAVIIESSTPDAQVSALRRQGVELIHAR